MWPCYCNHVFSASPYDLYLTFFCRIVQSTCLLVKNCDRVRLPCFVKELFCDPIWCESQCLKTALQKVEVPYSCWCVTLQTMNNTSVAVFFFLAIEGKMLCSDNVQRKNVLLLVTDADPYTPWEDPQRGRGNFAPMANW